MSQLQLLLLGEPVVKCGEETLTFSTRKALALLVYLAVEGGIHTRKTLSEALWPELDAEHGRATLRAILLDLRKSLERAHRLDEPTLLLAERDRLGLAHNTSLQLDLRFIETVSKHIEHQGAHGADQIDAELLMRLEQALGLIRGPFLAGFTLRDSPFFDHWTRLQREHWQICIHQLFDAMSRLYERAGDEERALESVNRWLHFDPLDEEGYRRLMQLRFSLGDRAGALRAYAICREVLAEELELEPEPETMALVNWIRHTVPVRSVPSQFPRSAREQPPATLLNSSFLGRAAEFHSLIECYEHTHTGQPHLILLQGGFGIGKTRLATEFLGWVQAQGADVLAGKAFQTGRQLPYQPLISALRHRLEREPALNDLISPVWLAELARLLPELRDRFPDLPVPMTDEALGHNHLFEAVTRLLLGWATRRPLVLLLDDMQWADAATLDLLLYFAQSLAGRPAPILLLLNLRTGAHTFPDPQPAWVMVLKRTGVPLTVLGLAPFTQEETRRFVQALVWGELHPEEEHNLVSERSFENVDPTAFEEPLESFAHWLYVQTHGQPFYLVEVLKELVEQEILAPSLQKDGAWGLTLRCGLLAQTPMSALIPAGVREVICSQLGELPGSARALLIAGAVIGEELTFKRLCQGAQLDEETGLHTLEEVLHSEWLCEENCAEKPQTEASYTFHGEMIREVVYQEAGAVRQRLVQQRVSGQSFFTYQQTLPYTAYFYHIRESAKDFPHSKE